MEDYSEIFKIEYLAFEHFDRFAVTGLLKGNKMGLSSLITVEDVFIREKGDNAIKMYYKSKKKVMDDDLKKYKKDKKQFDRLYDDYTVQTGNLLRVTKFLANDDSYQSQLEAPYLYGKISRSFSNVSSNYSSYFINTDYSYSFGKVLSSHKANMSLSAKNYSDLTNLLSRMNYSTVEFDEIHQKAVHYHRLGKEAFNDLNKMLKVNEKKFK